MSNPLAQLATQIGLTPESIAGLCGLPTDEVIKSLSMPSDAIQSYLKVAEGLGVRFKLAPAEFPAIRIDVRHLATLQTDSDFRRSCGLLEWPASKIALRDKIIEMRAAGMSFQSIGDRLVESHIPTMTGLVEWRKQQVAQLIRIGTNSDSLPIGEESAAKWLRWLVDAMSTEMCPIDPLAVVRYGFKLEETAEALTISRPGQIPEVVVRSIRSWLDSAWWLRWDVV